MNVKEIRVEIERLCGPKDGDGWIDLVVPAHERKDYKKGDPDKDYVVKVRAKTYRVPKAPFYKWALSRTAGAHLAPEWEDVSYPGMKMQLDDRAHTDWLIGAGITPAHPAWGSFTHPLLNAAYALRYDLLEKLLAFEVMVLNDAGPVHGALVQLAKPNESLKPIKRVPTGLIRGGVREWENVKRVRPVVALIPEPTPEYAPAIMSADAAILVRGSALIHLANVAREGGKTVVVDPDALRKYPPGTVLDINPGRGRIDVSEFQDTDYNWLFRWGHTTPEGVPER